MGRAEREVRQRMPAQTPSCTHVEAVPVQSGSVVEGLLGIRDVGWGALVRAVTAVNRLAADLRGLCCVPPLMYLRHCCSIRPAILIVN